MPKILFYFSGTGQKSFDFVERFEEENAFKDDVVRVYLQGCQHSKVGGGAIEPDLDIAANSILSSFNDGRIDIGRLRESFGDAIELRPTTSTGTIEIEKIGLYGFSRGAVSTFATAKKLDDLNIPINVIANQPVPGQMHENREHSLYQKYRDLSQCKHIETASIFLGSYYKENSTFQNVYFNQMVPEFNEGTINQNIIFPHQNHMKANQHPFLYLNVHKQFENLGYANRPAIMEEKGHVELLQHHYGGGDFYFTPQKFAQPIYGANKVVITVDPVYSEMVINNAISLFENKEIKPNYSQAHAILAISKVESIENKQSLYAFILQDTQKSRKFIEIVNNIDDTTEYLLGRIRVQEKIPVADGNNENTNLEDGKKKAKGEVKFESIKSQSQDYKHTLYCESYDYLTKQKPTDEDKINFVTKINQAEKKYIDEALNKYRSLVKPILKYLTNTLLLITGVGLAVNAINYARTGNWAVLKDTSSTKIAKKSLNEIKDILRDEESVEEKENIAPSNPKI